MSELNWEELKRQVEADKIEVSRIDVLDAVAKTVRSMTEGAPGDVAVVIGITVAKAGKEITAILFGDKTDAEVPPPTEFKGPVA